MVENGVYKIKCLRCSYWSDLEIRDLDYRYSQSQKFSNTGLASRRVTDREPAFAWSVSSFCFCHPWQLNPKNKDGVKYIITTCLDPWSSSMEFMDDLAGIMRNAILNAIGTVSNKLWDRYNDMEAVEVCRPLSLNTHIDVVKNRFQQFQQHISRKGRKKLKNVLKNVRT